MDAKTFDKSKLPSRHVTEGPARAPHRSYYYAMGLTEEEIHRPFVGVVSCWNEAAPCNIALMRQAQSAKKGVDEAGGTPREFCTITVTDGIAMGHQGMKSSLVSREVIANSIELTMRGHCYDAHGRPRRLRQVAARRDDGDAAPQRAVRVHVRRLDPARQVQGQGRDRGRRVRGRRPALRRQDVGRGSARARMRRLSRRRRLRRPVHRQHHGLVSEAIGLALPASAGAPAPYESRDEYAVGERQGGDAACWPTASARATSSRARRSRTPPPSSRRPAARPTAACTCRPWRTSAASSSTCWTSRAIFKRTPYIADLKPGGKYVAKDVYDIGGVPQLMRALLDGGYLHGDCMTVTGKTIKQNLEDVKFNPEPEGRLSGLEGA